MSAGAPARGLPDRREALRGHAAMLLFSGLVAGSFSLGSMAANEIAPATLNAVRFVVAAGILFGIAHATGGLSRAALRAPWRYVVLGGIFATYFVAMFEGLKTAAPVSLAAVFTLAPLLVALLGRLLFGQRTGGTVALALAIGAAGAVWVIFRADWQALRAFEVGRGEAIYFAGCICHAIFVLLVPRLNRGESPPTIGGATMAAGAVLLLVVGARDIVATDWAALPPIVWVTLAYVTLFASATTQIILQFASMRLPGPKVVAYTYLTPTWVIGWETALGKDVPPPLVLGGVGLTCLALLILLGRDA